MAIDSRYLASGGQWGTPANWGPDSVVPTAGDTVIIPSTLAADVTDAGAAADGIDFAVFVVHKGYQYSLGTAGSPIQLAAALIELYSAGPCYLECDLGGGAALDINEAIIALARPDVVCQLGSHTGDAGEWDLINILRGAVTITATMNFNAAGIVRVGFVKNIIEDVTLTISSSTETLATLEQNGGTTYIGNVVTTLRVNNGTCWKTENHATSTYIGPGGIVNWEDETEDADNASVWVLPGGFLDLMTTARPKYLDLVQVYPGGDIRYSPTLHTFGTFKDWRRGMKE